MINYNSFTLDYNENLFYIDFNNNFIDEDNDQSTNSIYLKF